MLLLIFNDEMILIDMISYYFKILTLIFLIFIITFI